MYARSTTINGSPDAIDAGIAHIRDEVMPAVTAMEGCVGVSLVVDRETGRCIATTSWETKEAMDATAQRVAPMRSSAAALLGGAPVVEMWEVAAMHRDHRTHDGSCCRITWSRAEDPDAALEMWRTMILPRIEELDGFCSASMLVDRDRRIGCGTVTFDSRGALEATRQFAAGMRERAVNEMKLEILDVGEFDLALAHLRVPELV